MVILAFSTSDYQIFDKEGIYLEYPGNWNENPIPSNDQELAQKSGFNIIGVFLEGWTIQNYTYYMGIAQGDLSNGNLTEAADRLYNNFIIREADDHVEVNIIRLKNGYQTHVYTYNGTGVSSGKKIYERTYIFTKDYKKAYYVMLTSINPSIQENNQIWQSIMDTVLIK